MKVEANGGAGFSGINEAAGVGCLGKLSVSYASESKPSSALAGRTEGSGLKGVLTRVKSLRLTKAHPEKTGERGLRNGLKGLDGFERLKEGDPNILQQVLISHGVKPGLGESVAALRLISKVGMEPWSQQAREMLSRKVEGVAVSQWEENSGIEQWIKAHASAGFKRAAVSFSELAHDALFMRDSALYTLDGGAEADERHLDNLCRQAESERLGKVRETWKKVGNEVHKALEHFKQSTVTLTEEDEQFLRDAIIGGTFKDSMVTDRVRTQGDLDRVEDLALSLLPGTGSKPAGNNRLKPSTPEEKALKRQIRDVLDMLDKPTLDAGAIERLKDDILNRRVDADEIRNRVKTPADVKLVSKLATFLTFGIDPGLPPQAMLKV